MVGCYLSHVFGYPKKHRTLCIPIHPRRVGSYCDRFVQAEFQALQGWISILQGFRSIAPWLGESLVQGALLDHGGPCRARIISNTHSKLYGRLLQNLCMTKVILNKIPIALIQSSVYTHSYSYRHEYVQAKSSCRLDFLGFGRSPTCHSPAAYKTCCLPHRMFAQLHTCSAEHPGQHQMPRPG